MEPEQAEGMARALGEELGEHMAVKGDLQSGFSRSAATSEPRSGRSAPTSAPRSNNSVPTSAPIFRQWITRWISAARGSTPSTARSIPCTRRSSSSARASVLPWPSSHPRRARPRRTLPQDRRPRLQADLPGGRVRPAPKRPHGRQRRGALQASDCRRREITPAASGLRLDGRGRPPAPTQHIRHALEEGPNEPTRGRHAAPL